MATPLNSVEHSRLGVIRKGDYLGKYGRQGSMKPRFFILSKDGQRLEFKGRGQHRIPFKSVMLVAPGRESANFKSKDGDLHRTDPAKFRHLSSLSFSVHYYDVDGFSRSLDLQCIGNNEHKSTAEEQYAVWFNGLSMLVHVVRTYEHIPQAILSQDVVISPSPLSGLNGVTTASIASSNSHTTTGVGMPSPNQQQYDHLTSHSARMRGVPYDVDDAGSTTHTTQSTEPDMNMARSTQAYTPASTISAGDNAASARRNTPFSVTGPWPGPPVQTKTSLTQDAGISQQETHVVFTCGHDALGGAGAQPTGTLAKLETFANVDVQQVVISSRSVACIDGARNMYMAGTTADGEHFPTASKLPCLNNQKVVQAACAHSAVFALADTGRVLAWGRCASGLLGMTSRVAVFSPKALKFLTAGPSPREVAVRFLAAGVHHCAAISDGSLLFTWGDGAYGRLGHGNMDSCFEPRVVSSLQQRRVSTVSCGAYHTAAVCVDMPLGDGEGSQHRVGAGTSSIGGTLYTWGGAFDIQTTMGSATTSSNEGCLGLPMLQRHEGVVKPHPVELPNVIGVACGLNFTVALDLNGQVFQMGSMLREGEVPSCPWEGAPEPTRVKGELLEAHVTHISAGTSHVIAAARSLRDSLAGEKPPSLVLTWGANDKGQLARNIQALAPRRGASDLHAGQMEQILCLTPAQVMAMRGYPVSGIVASADSTAVVVAVPKQQQQQAAALGKSASGRLGRRGSGPLSPNSSKSSGQNPAMKLLRSVRTSTGNLGKAMKEGLQQESPSIHAVPAYSASTSAPSQSGMVVLDSTMPSSTWVNPVTHIPGNNAEAVRADGPRIMHVGGAIAAAVVPGGMAPLSGPIPGLDLPRQQQQMPMPPPMPHAPPANREYERVQAGAVDQQVSPEMPLVTGQEAPPPAMAYANTAEMMRRLNRGGPMRGIGAVPAVPNAGFLAQNQEPDRLSQGSDVRNGSPSMMCAEEKDGAINDRIAWLERVINDRNMEVSLAGAPEPDKLDMPCVDRPDNDTPQSDVEDRQYRNVDLNDMHRQAGNLGQHDQGHSRNSSGQPAAERHVQEWKAEMVAQAHMAVMHPQQEQGVDNRDDGVNTDLASQETMPLYHMPQEAQSRSAMQDTDSNTTTPDGYAADVCNGDLGGHLRDMQELSGVTEGDDETPAAGESLDGRGDALDGQYALDDLEQRHLILQQAGLPSISEQPDRNESDTSGALTNNLQYTQDHDSRGGVAPPASTQAASHTAGTVGTATDILSSASLPGGLTFLNAGTPHTSQSVSAMPSSNPHYDLTAGSAVSGHTLPSAAPRSISSDPFSNVWQQLHQRPPSVQLLSLSSSVAGGATGPTANAYIHDNTSQMAELRLEIEKLRKELSEEKSAHKALQSRTLELRTRLSQAQYEPPNKQSPGDMDNANVVDRFKSLVERNPVIVDSFWVPVDDGVSARLDVAEYTGLGKLKFSSRLFDNRAVKEWYKKNKHRVEVGSLVSSLPGVNAGLSTEAYAATQSTAKGAAGNHATQSSMSETGRSSDQSGRHMGDSNSAVRVSEKTDVAVA